MGINSAVPKPCCSYCATEPGAVDDPLRIVVYQAIGAASTCWDSEGVFLSEKAAHIAEGLISWIQRNYE